MSASDLWHAVLALAVSDALGGVPVSGKSPAARMAANEAARRYVTTPSADLALVCALAGMDMGALVERMRARVANPSSTTSVAAGSRSCLAG